MIHHLSVSARDPNAVADFFAELIGGVSVDFPPNPGSRMVFKADGHGTGVEIYPAGSVMARARGWESYVCDRGGHFHVVEVWIENAWLVEALTPTFAEEYLGFANAVTDMADPNSALGSHQPQDRTLENA